MKFPRSLSFVSRCLSLIAALAVGSSIASAQDTKPATPPADEHADAAMLYAKMTTNHGTIILELNRAKAPISVKNFVAYVEAESYDGTIFHRVIPSFMIQGGGFKSDFQKVPTEAPIKNEWQNGLSNMRGTIAMARTNVVDSATNQFYINVVDNQGLDGAPGKPGYAVFGKVIAGMDVADKIRNVPTATNMQARMQNVPVETVLIESVRMMSEEDAKAAVEAAKMGTASRPGNE